MKFPAQWLILIFALTLGSAFAQNPTDPEYQRYLREKAEAARKEVNGDLIHATSASGWVYVPNGVRGESAGIVNVEAIRKALTAGADANVRIEDRGYSNDRGWSTPLLQVVSHAYGSKLPARVSATEEAVKLLIQAGAEVNPALDEGRTLLIEALYASAPASVIRQLVAFPTAKEVINEINPRRKLTGIQAAFRSGQPETVRLLIDLGAESTSPGEAGEILKYLNMSSPELPALFDLAVGLVGIERLKKSMNEFVGTENGRRLLLLNEAIKEGKLAGALFYLKNLGANPLLKDGVGQSAETLTNELMEQCVGYKSCSQVSEFQKQMREIAGVQVDSTNPRGYTCQKYVNCQPGARRPFCTEDYLDWANRSCTPAPLVVH